MTTDTDTTTDASLRDHLTSRRHLLKLLGLIAATGRASAQSDGDVAVGGGGAGHGFRHGAHSGAPATIPPANDTLLWTKRGAQTAVCVSGAALPQTVSANGLQWSFAGDLATAKSNVGSQPALAVAPGGITTYAGGLPAVVDGDGLRTVIAGDLTTAESERGTATPALLFGDSEGELEVVL